MVYYIQYYVTMPDMRYSVVNVEKWKYKIFPMKHHVNDIASEMYFVQKHRMNDIALQNLVQSVTQIFCPSRG